MDERIMYAGASLVPIEAAMHLLGTGSIGAAVGLGLSGLVFVAIDELKGKGADNSAPSPVSKAEKRPGKQGIAYKLFNGKSQRGEDGEGDQAGDSGVAPGIFMLDDVIGVAREFNRQGMIYFGESLDGAVAIHLHDLIHVLDISSSGKGKSNRQRLIMPQVAKMAQTFYINPLCNKVKPVKDDRQYEIWAPIYDLLAMPPIKDGGEIKQVLKAIAEEIEVRNDQEAQNDYSWRDDTIVVFIDEMPEVNARCPQAAEYLDKIGRMGRQYNIILYLCSQTAQVTNIGLSSAAQSNFKTMEYGGGDQISANRVMKGSVPKDKERVLQSEKGLTLMLADGLVDTTFVRAPLVTNTGLFEYLDLPPFNLDQWVSTSNTARSTSRIAGLSTSAATSRNVQNDGSNQTVKSDLKGSVEAGGSGLEVAEVVEVDQEAEETLSERDQQIIDMFVNQKMGMAEIARQLSGAAGGSAYQKTSSEVTTVIRDYMMSLRG